LLRLLLFLESGIAPLQLWVGGGDVESLQSWPVLYRIGESQYLASLIPAGPDMLEEANI
jgi:hypothetical protein